MTGLRSAHQRRASPSNLSHLKLLFTQASWLLGSITPILLHYAGGLTEPFKGTQVENVISRELGAPQNTHSSILFNKYRLGDHQENVCKFSAQSDSRCRVRLHKSWKDSTKEWTGQSLPLLLQDDRRHTQSSQRMHLSEYFSDARVLVS